MKTVKCIKTRLAGCLALVFALLLGTGLSAVPVRAESGTVYTCVIHPCYAHPVTGEIEIPAAKRLTPPARAWWREPSIRQVFWK